MLHTMRFVPGCLDVRNDGRSMHEFEDIAQTCCWRWTNRVDAVRRLRMRMSLKR